MSGWLDLSKKDVKYEADRAFYETLRQNASRQQLVERWIVGPGKSKGFRIRKGRTFRVVEETGPQIATVAFWNADEPRETLIAGRTIGSESLFVSPCWRGWSDFPWARPMVTCIEDTIRRRVGESVDPHHFIGGHCSPELIEMRLGSVCTEACRVGLTRAIAPFGLKEADIRDTVNMFQRVALQGKRGTIAISRSEAIAGDYVEFYAELDLVVAVTVCPFGDGTSDPVESVAQGKMRPVGVAVYETGSEPRPFPGWTDWRPAWRGHWQPPESDPRGLAGNAV